MTSLFLLIPVFFPILSGAASLIIPFRNDKFRNIYVMSSLLISSAFVWISAVFSSDETLILLNFTENLNFSLKLDGAGKIFSCLSATLWPLTALYAFEYMQHEKHLKMFYSFFVGAFGAVMGIAYAENMLTMYLFYELLTISTIPLVMHGMTHKDKFAARKYMVYSIGGAAFAFCGVTFLIVNNANSFIYGGALSSFNEDIFGSIIFLFAFMGFGVKAAIFPFHSWLPCASVAPTPVTALLHAVAVVKAGAFALIRLIYYSYGTDNLRGTSVHYIIMLVCIFTIVFGSTNALRQRHFKKRLAFSTVSNLSYITFAATLMTPAGLIAAFCHMIFHSAIKIGAFFSAGAVLHTQKKEYISELEGIGRTMPVTMGCYLISSLALTGIPPLCGFFSKWNIATAAVETDNIIAVLGVAGLLISAFLTAVYMLSPAIKAFFPNNNSETNTAVKEADKRMLIPLIICAAVSILFGVFAKIPVNMITEVLGI